MKKIIPTLLWLIEPLLGFDGKPSLRNILATILCIRLLFINECGDDFNDSYVTTLALLITGLLGLKAVDFAISKINDKNEGDNIHS